MKCDIIQTAVDINNRFNTNIIPYSFLTRPEKEPLMDLNKLDVLCIQNSNYIKPYKRIIIEETLKSKYQTLCHIHLQALMDKEKIGNYIYISMDHIVEQFKDYKEFYNCELYNHLHIVLELYYWDDDGIYVKSVQLNREEYLKHMEIARIKEKQYNLKYNLKEYIQCPCCLPTLCSVALYYKDNIGDLPTKLSQIPKEFSNALILIKNDRLNIENTCLIAQVKWKSHNFEQYFTKLNNICESRQWEYEKIIEFIYKNHIDIIKTSERMRDKNSNQESWDKKSRNLNSPSWRSNIAVS